MRERVPERRMSERQIVERKYLVGEIDRMREIIRWLYPDGVVYAEMERAAEIELKLRTYMQNGTEPEELERALSDHFDRLRKRSAGSKAV